MHHLWEGALSLSHEVGPVVALTARTVAGVILGFASKRAAFATNALLQVYDHSKSCHLSSPSAWVAESGSLDPDADETAIAGRRTTQSVVVVHEDLVVVAAARCRFRVIARGDAPVGPVSLAVALRDRARSHAFP